jgi:hypothetical protein
MGNAGHATMFRAGVLRNECRGSNLVAYRMLTPPAHPMNDGLSLYPQAGAVSCLRPPAQIASKKAPIFCRILILEARARILSRSRKAAPYSVGSFVISKSFISAATRNCPAFLIASIRFDPGGSFLAFSSASEALASQSCRSTLPCVSFILFSHHSEPSSLESQPLTLDCIGSLAIISE